MLEAKFGDDPLVILLHYSGGLFLDFFPPYTNYMSYSYYAVQQLKYFCFIFGAIILFAYLF